ncbi:hypothetical protein [Croceibacterium aestuarii]|uniref:hypothetical protein n=1 Tax=Croceibacterium aestuarii TaxID=3064139 RepID=UPI00272E9DC6|nr:hypothetical protein [Croceibacterium sp. D39]
MPRPFRTVLLALLLAFAGLAGFAQPAAAKVSVEFHSFNGSVLFGRYPHTFVVFKGKLDDTGQTIDENFGFTAKHVTPAILTGPVKQAIWVEEPKWIAKTNTHFTVTVDDATYRKMREEVELWRNHPGDYYDLDTRNCIHFVGRIAEMAGLKVDFPRKLLRKPRAWLNHISELNPQLKARPIKG